MKGMLLKSRKLILFLLLGFRFGTVGISFFNVHGVDAAIPLATLSSNLRINAGDRLDFEPEYHDRGMMHIPDRYRYRNNDNSYNKDSSDVMIARRSRSVIIQSEAGPIQTSYSAAIKKSPISEYTKSEQLSNDDDVYRESYTATTSRIIGLNLTQPERYHDDYYSDEQENDEEQNENDEKDSRNGDFLSNTKTIWDIFIALNTAWNAIGEQQIQHAEQRKVRTEDERLKRDSNYSTSVTTRPNIYNYPMEIYRQYTTSPLFHSSTETAIAEGRYIKGDPLKGYYDFVITEGSYKFWAAFQLATAVLIIYSTFAAIYYSKVNPLVGDYDYVDYLGGARSISDDSDFIDAQYNGSGPSETDTSPNAPGWLSILHRDWMPRVGHTVKFILEAIDKIPQ